MPSLNPGSWKLGLQRARLTLHEADPITGNEDILSSLFYEFYRGYTIYSTRRAGAAAFTARRAVSSCWGGSCASMRWRRPRPSSSTCAGSAIPRLTAWSAPCRQKIIYG